MPKTILLLGGTSETAPLAESLTEQGFSVLVSTATAVPLNIGRHPHIRRRTGPLDEARLLSLIEAEGIKAILDATHPYAELIGPQARTVALQRNLPYFRWLRPAALAGETGITFAADHAQAAALSFSFGPPVLLTIGSKNLEPYIRESRRTGRPVVARVLDHPDTRVACQKLGLSPEAVIFGKGPFSIGENRSRIREFGIGVLVTKDSGKAGGVPEKIKAAEMESCRVVVVRRPEQTGEYFDQVELLIKTLLEVLT